MLPPTGWLSAKLTGAPTMLFNLSSWTQCSQDPKKWISDGRMSGTKDPARMWFWAGEEGCWWKLVSSSVKWVWHHSLKRALGGSAQCSAHSRCSIYGAVAKSYLWTTIAGSPGAGPAIADTEAVFRIESTDWTATRSLFSPGLIHHLCETQALLYKRRHLTFILLCLIPSTICSIWRKNWSRPAGEAMALKDKPVEEWPAHELWERRN